MQMKKNTRTTLKWCQNTKRICIQVEWSKWHRRKVSGTWMCCIPGPTVAPAPGYFLLVTKMPFPEPLTLSTEIPWNASSSSKETLILFIWLCPCWRCTANVEFVLVVLVVFWEIWGFAALLQVFVPIAAHKVYCSLIHCLKLSQELSALRCVFDQPTHLHLYMDLLEAGTHCPVRNYLS